MIGICLTIIIIWATRTFSESTRPNVADGRLEKDDVAIIYVLDIRLLCSLNIKTHEKNSCLRTNLPNSIVEVLVHWEQKFRISNSRNQRSRMLINISTPLISSPNTNESQVNVHGSFHKIMESLRTGSLMSS